MTTRRRHGGQRLAPVLLSLLCLLSERCHLGEAFLRCRPWSTRGAGSRIGPPSATTSGGSRDDAGQGGLPLSIYIEHTDRYQVVYNANYLKFLSR